MKIYVVVLNWNRSDDTIKCVKSVMALRITSYELNILIVDNGSSDDSIRIVRNFQFPMVRQALRPRAQGRVAHHPEQSRGISNFQLIKNKKNLGFAGGNNVGIKCALDNSADYVLILNNDTIVDKNLIESLLETAKKYPRAGAISPKIYFAKDYEFHKDRYEKSELGKVIWYAGGGIDWKNVYGLARGVDEVDRGQYDKLSETDFATGTCMLISRKALEKVGLFDEKYFMYYEDTDLSVRVNKAGFKVFYAPSATVWHKVAQSSGIGSDLNDYFITRNRLLFGFRYASIRSRLAIVRESIKLLVLGRKWQKKGVVDFYFGKFGQGSWPNG